MAIVVFSKAQLDMVDGETRVEIEAGRVAELITALYARFPKLDGKLDNAAVAVNGEIHNHGKYLRLESDTEVHFMGAIAGGSGDWRGSF